ncbi:transporter, major facilitator family protein [Oesophagostomum dentatum]|uniref:Transporter, major facilitator family protein n=1 Tax=Oesophagostomum dentatum TaxID=61180 RepID=A0A0B1TED8_OESDE|nr:transporter, major facilitator family protein [Oesophagostomum dentatum]
MSSAVLAEESKALSYFFQEVSPLSIRGMASFLCEIGYGAMVVLGMVLGMTCVLGESLDILVLIPLAPLTLSLVFLAFIPETPKFLMIMKGDREKALRSLEFFRGDEKGIERLLDDYEREKLQEASQERSSLKEIFSTWNLRHAVYLASSVLFLTWSFYPMLTSSTSFFKRSNIHRTLAEMMSALLMLIFTISSVIGASFVDKYPRRFLVIFSGVLSNVFLVLFAVFSMLSYDADWIKYACIAAALLYCISFGMVLGPVSWFVAPELVPLKHKSLVFSLCFGANNAFIAVTDFLAIVLFEKYGAIVFIALFTIPSIICLIFVYLYLPETKGKEIEGIIEEMLKKAKKSPMKTEEPAKPVRSGCQIVDL